MDDNDTTIMNLQTDIMQVLTKNPNNLFSQFEIYKGIHEKRDIKDPREADDLKFKLMVELRLLPTNFTNIKVINNRGIYSAMFEVSDKSSDSVDKQSESLKNDEESYEKVGTTTTTVSDKIHTEKYDMPDELTTIRRIIDNNMEDLIIRKDFLGNNILHILAMYGDYERFKKMLYRKDLSLSDENNEGKTVFDYITDFRISSLIMKNLVDTNIDNEYNILVLQTKCNDLEKYVYPMSTFFQIVLCIIIARIVIL